MHNKIRCTNNGKPTVRKDSICEVVGEEGSYSQKVSGRFINMD